MAESFFDKIYKNKTQHTPDVLSCLANLSNDEVFTPPDVVNQMLDLLPQELFQNPNTTFLDPACKTGVFLREIAKRLLVGLEDKIPNLQERIDHIFHKQLYGIAITELTSLLSRRSLYCSKYPNGPYSITKFDNPEGNIRFRRINHTWGKNKKCVFCGANKEQWDRGENLETYAYEWIHTNNPEEIFKMKFDVIISNPPYQMNTGGGSAQAMPVYDKFVASAKQLNPRYQLMIIPSRWFAGGISLDNFRKEMLNDPHIKRLVDFSNAKDCFPESSIGGGVCYYLWDRAYNGPCEVINNHNGKETKLIRKLNEYDIFVRYNEAIDIIDKIRNRGEDMVSSICSSLSPFGIPSSERGLDKPFKGAISLYSSKGVGYISENEKFKNNVYFNKYKVMISKTTAEHAGEPDKEGKFKVLSTMKVLQPKEVCTFSYFLIGGVNNLKECRNLINYLKTKFARFLVLQAVSSINLTKDKFCFVPQQDFSKEWTDNALYKKYSLTKEEISFIESMIRPYGGDN